VNDPGLDPETAERMARGEPAGPPKLAKLLAAASSEPAAGELCGEDAAVAAFRQARSQSAKRPSWCRLSALVSLKTALIGLLLALAGGVTVAAASQHLPSPLGHEHSPPARTPSTSDTVPTHPSARASSHPAPSQPPKKRAPAPTCTRPKCSPQSADPSAPIQPPPTTAVTQLPDPRKTPKGEGPKTPKVKVPKPNSATRSAPTAGIPPTGVDGGEEGRATTGR
jgi:hypothetical protein